VKSEYVLYRLSLSHLNAVNDNWVMNSVPVPQLRSRVIKVLVYPVEKEVSVIRLHQGLHLVERANFLGDKRFVVSVYNFVTGIPQDAHSCQIVVMIVDVQSPPNRFFPSWPVVYRNSSCSRVHSVDNLPLNSCRPSNELLPTYELVIWCVEIVCC